MLYNLHTPLNDDITLTHSTKDNIHMSFDIDSLDPSLSPSTGTPGNNSLEQ